MTPSGFGELFDKKIRTALAPFLGQPATAAKIESMAEALRAQIIREIRRHEQAK